MIIECLSLNIYRRLLMYVGINMYTEKERKERKIGSSHDDREARQKTSNSNSFISPNIHSKLNAANIDCHSIMTVKSYVYMSEGEAEVTQ